MAKRHQINLTRKGNIKRKHSHSKVSLTESVTKTSKFTSRYTTQIKDAKSGNTYEIVQLLEYSNIFPGKTIDIREEIKCFSRDTLVKTVFILGRNFGKCMISDMHSHPFFSYKSKDVDERMYRISRYIKNNGRQPNNVSYAGEKTFLELLKLTFSVHTSDEIDQYPSYLAEVKMFDLLLAINEQKVTKFKFSVNTSNELAKMLFVNQYSSSEFSNLNGKLTLVEQMYYARTFFEFITSREEYSDLYNYFLSLYGIVRWQDYYRTILMLGVIGIEKGLNHIKLSKCDTDSILDKNVLKQISKEKNSYIETEVEDKNRDISIFRSKPLIHINNDEYCPFCVQLMLYRLYNGIYFDLLNSNFAYKKKKCGLFYKEIFVEKYLFDRTLLSCLNECRISTCFPQTELIETQDFVDIEEENNQPDFYVREGNNVFIFECKAVKLNGELKTDSDVDNIMAEISNKLHSKVYTIQKGKVKYLNNPKPEGIGQLINHIISIENHSFKWDSCSSEDFVYYPILVLENREVAQNSLSSILNDWYQNDMARTGISNAKYRPVIVITIKTLFLYNYQFKKNGFNYYFDRYFKENLQQDLNRKYSINPLCSFDSWMENNFQCDKQDYYQSICAELSKPHPID